VYLRANTFPLCTFNNTSVFICELKLIWFSKKPQVAKPLLAGFEVVLIGRKDDREKILASVQSKLPALSEKVTAGANPYLIAADASRDYILAELKKCSQEERVALLDRIANRKHKDMPHIFELIAHVNYCLTILEDPSKPLIPPGSALNFLTPVAEWFASSDKLLRRVLIYFDEATQLHRQHLHETRRRNERRFR